MTERYLISGAQIGAIRALVTWPDMSLQTLIQQIEDDQFIGHSRLDIKDDAVKLSKQFKQTK